MKRIDYNKKFRFLKSIDWKLTLIVSSIFIYGLIVLSSATHANVTGDFTQIYKQLTAFIIGIIIIAVILLFDYNNIGKYHRTLYIVSILLLAVVMIPGVGNTQFGAKSWIKIGSFNFQTSELVKTTFTLCFASVVDKNKKTINDPKTLLKLIGYMAPFIILLLLQPDLGTAIVFMFISFFMIYSAGLDNKILRKILIALLILTPIMFLFMAPHQRVRITNFFNPESSTNYQVLQSMIAIGSGGLLGKGLYNGSQNQENFLPVRDSDFIFAVIGEELGLIGMLVMLILFALLITRLLMIAKKSKNSYGTYIVMGITGMFVYQVIQNIGMTVGLMPVTGVTLPFVSYGGSSLLTSMANIGIVLNIFLRRRNTNLFKLK
ncbi:rod shape-determining protein RodA [Peptostreptococcus equinus]|uniref:Rod shape-determining protein RodA n=1 Tax=Peptostreptococcus equinus TaxID=3003601 RepID=A0ABY7JQG4_9FIRM|nr:rod shape-determining protein RodA [Peptostreptococcus sp. CBA3647]WAW14283.1 rod shape-determining protein RodA [Peptostreptococcus sp. CBA3647]